MSNQVQYYSRGQGMNNGSGNVGDNYGQFSEANPMQSPNYERRSWSDRQNISRQQNEYLRNEPFHQQPYSHSPPKVNNYDRSRNVDNKRNSYEASQQYNHRYDEANQGPRDSNTFTNRDNVNERSWQQNHQMYNPQNDDRETEQRMQNMHVTESHRSPDRYDADYSQNNRNQGSYNAYNHRPSPGNQSESFQNNYRQPQRPEKRDVSYSDNHMTPHQEQLSQPSAYNEPAHLHQVRQPKVIAKATNDGSEVAVFGVIAKVSPPSTLRPQSDHHQPYEQQPPDRQQPPPQGSPTRTHQLAPIIEQPSFPPSTYNRDRNPAHYDDRNRGYSERNHQNRRPPLPQKPRPNAPTTFDRPYPSPGVSDGQRDGHRDEHTDSSGYGSALTERSYDGPRKDHQVSYPQGRSGPRYEDRAQSNGPRSPPWQQQRSNFSERNPPPERNSDWRPSQSNQAASDQYYEHNNAQQSEHRTSHWTLQKTSQARNYEQRTYQQRGNEDVGVDKSHQIKGVRAVKEMFEKPGSSVVLPPKSSAYGPNQYNNTRPVPPRPKLSSSDGGLQQQQQSLSQPRSPTYQHNQQLFPRSHQTQGNFNQSPTTRYQGPPPQQYQHPQQQRHGFNQQSDSERRGEPNAPRQNYPPSHEQYQDRRRYDDAGEYDSSSRAPLPHFELPPQHSQSMGQLDNLRPDRPSEPQVPNSRNSHSNIRLPPEDAMVVGVRFEKSSHQDRGQSRPQLSLPPKPFPSDEDARPRSEVEFTQEESQFYNQSRSHNEQSRAYDYGRQRNSQSYESSRFGQQREPAAPPPSGDRNYVPDVVAQSYQKFNDEPPNNQPMRSQHPSVQTQPFGRDQEQYGPPDPSYVRSDVENLHMQEQRFRNSQSPNQTNYVSNVAEKKFVQFSPATVQIPLHSADGRRLQTQNNFGQSEGYQEDSSAQYGAQEYSNPMARSQQEHTQGRQPPTGGDNVRSTPHVPRHPFDPVDEDDSSDGIDVDAPTPPPTSRQPPMSYQSQGGPRNDPPDGRGGNEVAQPRPVTTGEKLHQVHRQPGDGLNNDPYSGNLQGFQQKPIVGARPTAPRKPERNSIKKANKSALQQAEQNLLPVADKEEPRPLNHGHAMERARLVKAGRLSRKPPSRAISSGALMEGSAGDSNCEITVTSNDLVKQQTAPITTEQPIVSVNNPTEKPSRSQRNKQSLTEGTQTDLPVKHEAKKDNSKLVFKLPSEEALKRQAAVNPLPDIQEPAGNDRKKPPTYTGFGNSPKQKRSLGAALLDQFQSARENALRSAAKKQDRALKSVQAIARMAKRSTSPVKSPTRSPNDIRTKDNRDIYRQSKPKPSRDATAPDLDDSDSDSFDDRRGRERSSHRDRGRSRARSNEREVSPERRGRSRSRDRSRSPERRGRSRSRDRLRSPERRERSRSRDRIMSPDRRERDRSRERHLDRENRARKSERDRIHRPVSPYRHGRDEPPYPRSYLRKEEPPYHHHHRSDEPDWVEQHRRRRAADEPAARRRAWVNDPRWRQRKDLDSIDRDPDVRRADPFEQPQRKQMLPSKLMAGGGGGRPPPNRRTPPGNNDWMRNLKEKNRASHRNRR